MVNVVSRSAVVLGLLISLGVRSAGAEPACPAPVDPRQAQLDQAGVSHEDLIAPRFCLLAQLGGDPRQA